MAIELIKERYASVINTVEIGTAAGSARAGGESALSFMFGEGSMPNAPIAALEVLDCEPVEWPESLMKALGTCVKDPVEWAIKSVKDFGSKLLCVRLQGVNPDWNKTTVDGSVTVLKAIADKVSVPLVVLGCGDDERDNELLPKASQALKGRNALFGIAEQDNYKTLTATCLADGHSIIAESPIDINIAKQVNILITDMGFDPKRIVMHPTTTSLGYGMEYVYSIMERARLAAFMGDAMLSMPFILFPGQEVWRTKEAKESAGELGANWELATAVSMIQAGADILIMRHPAALSAAQKYIAKLMKG